MGEKNIQLIERIYKKASLCRAFEKSVFSRVQSKILTSPVYLSAGQEYIASTLAVKYESLSPNQRQIFIQHRGHSIYLAFGGSIEKLIYELLGHEGGCAFGMGGSASIQSFEANIYGHDGLMGSHGPISVGMCYANKLPTICFAGDAAAEEDYFLASIGWASTKNLPIIFVIEDNDLSILTKKSVRRNWEMSEVAKGFRINAFNISDDPYEILQSLPDEISKPLLLNINTTRLFWHSGAGIDDEDSFDRHKAVAKIIGEEMARQIDSESKFLVEEKWVKCLSH